MGARLAFLDLLTNAMGAMLIMFVLVSSKHFVRPEVPVAGLLVVEATSLDSGASLGAWLRPRGGATFVDEVVESMPTARPRDDKASSRRQSGSTEILTAFLSSTSSAGSVKSSTVSMVAVDPIEGCYEVGIYLKDHAQIAMLRDEGVGVQVRIWFRGPVNEGWEESQSSNPRSFTLFAPTSTAVIPLKIARPAKVETCD